MSLSRAKWCAGTSALGFYEMYSLLLRKSPFPNIRKTKKERTFWLPEHFPFRPPS